MAWCLHKHTDRFDLLYFIVVVYFAIFNYEYEVFQSFYPRIPIICWWFYDANINTIKVREWI